MPTEPQILIREASEAPLSDSYIIEGENPDIDLAVRNLRERGYVILRGCLPKDAVDAVAERTEEMLRQPSVAGVWGYYRADHQKKVIQPTNIASIKPSHITPNSKGDQPTNIIRTMQNFSSCCVAQGVWRNQHAAARPTKEEIQGNFSLSN